MLPPGRLLPDVFLRANSDRPAMKPREATAAADDVMTAARKRNPERTRSKILAAATAEFAGKGLKGARIAGIARRAKANQRMIYHYFGNKEALYVKVLEASYSKIRTAEQSLKLEQKEPVEAILSLIDFTFDYYLKNPDLISLLNGENIHRAKYVRMSKSAVETNTSIIDAVTEILQRGARMGVFRDGIDPVDLYISVSALAYTYFSNRHTFGAIFRRDFLEPGALAQRKESNKEMILLFLRLGAPDGPGHASDVRRSHIVGKDHGRQ
jgi:AcrR family transcriptional regulator